MNKFVIFIFGAATGSLLTWKLIEKKYKDLADKEIQSVKEVFAERDVIDYKTSNEKIENPSIKIIKHEYRCTDEIPKDEYDKLTSKLGYDLEISKEDNVIVSEEDGSIFIEPAKECVAPYVISPEEFGELEYYDTNTWTLYADSIITDEQGCVVEEPENKIGDALEHFGEFEEDAVHVRNENLENDYEIIKVDVTFEDINRRDFNDVASRN